MKILQFPMGRKNNTDSEMLLTMINALIEELHLMKLNEQAQKEEIIALKLAVEQLKRVNRAILIFLHSLQNQTSRTEPVP